MNKGSLFIAILGAVAFFKGISLQYDHEEAERNLSATSPSAAVEVNARKGYRPSLHKDAGFGHTNQDEIQSANQEQVSAVVEGTPSENNADEVQLENVQQAFEQQRGQLEQSLVKGDVESAIESSREFLNREMISGNDTNKIAYFLDFYMLHQVDDDAELKAVGEALEKASNMNVRNFLYSQYRSKAPEMSQDIDDVMSDLAQRSAE